MVKEVDRVDTLVRPRSLAIEESIQVDEVDLTSPADVDGVLVATRTWLGRMAFLLIEVDSDAGIVTGQALTGPSQLVGVPNPEVGGLTKLGLDSRGVPDLLQQDTLGVVEGVAAVVKLVEVSIKSSLRYEETYIILMDDSVRGLDDVEGVKHDFGGLAELVEVLGTLRKRARDGELMVVSKENVIMPRSVEAGVLVKTMGRGILANHDEDGK